MKGCYCIVVNLKKDSKIKIGKKLGIINFKKGCYVYVGSAMNNLESRLNRHLSNEKKLHWHIDYLLMNKNSEIKQIIYNLDKKVECDISKQLSNITESVESFGCSDCNCNSHLYYFKNDKIAVESVENVYDSIAIPCKKYISEFS